MRTDGLPADMKRIRWMAWTRGVPALENAGYPQVSGEGNRPGEAYFFLAVFFLAGAFLAAAFFFAGAFFGAAFFFAGAFAATAFFGAAFFFAGAFAATAFFGAAFFLAGGFLLAAAFAFLADFFAAISPAPPSPGRFRKTMIGFHYDYLYA